MKITEVFGTNLYWKKGESIKLHGFHTTNNHIRNFSLKKSPGGIYFHATNNGTSSGADIKAEITLSSPLITNDRRTVQHSDIDRREEMTRQGYDGMIWMGTDGQPIEIVSFDPRQIRILDNPTR